MFAGLQQRIGLEAGGRFLLLAKTGAHDVEAPAQPAAESIKRFQGEGCAQRFRDGFQRGTRQEAGEQPRQQRGGHAVARQHAGKENCKGAPATAASTAIGAESALAARTLFVGAGGIVAQQAAVAIQRATLAAVGAALLLERKSSVFNAGSSRTNRVQEGRIVRLMREGHGPSRAFFGRHC